MTYPKRVLIADSEQHVVEARLFNGEILVVRFG